MADVDHSERPSPFWNDARVEILTTMWAANYSCSEIARELGGVTRNSIIGKVHRLELPTRVKAKRKPEPPRIRPSRAKPKPAAAPRHNQTPPSLLAERKQAVDDRQAQFASEAEGGTADAFDRAIPRRQRKTIFQLESKHCKFPIGDPQDKSFFCCGAWAVEGLPYCSRHAARCYCGVAKKPRHEFRLK